MAEHYRLLKECDLNTAEAILPIPGTQDYKVISRSFSVFDDNIERREISQGCFTLEKCTITSDGTSNIVFMQTPTDGDFAHSKRFTLDEILDAITNLSSPA